MTREELEHKEETLRHCFMKKLEALNTDGTVSLHEVKCVKTYGALWHYAHELLKLGEHEEENKEASSADMFSMQATGIKMVK